MRDTNIIADILHREGGYVDRASDRGGPTNMGITMPTLSAWRGVPVTKADIQSLTAAEATAIYQSKYVDPWGFIAHDVLREILVDWGVNSGLAPPTKVLQNFLVESGIGVKTDGVLGDKTRNAWASLIAISADYADLAARRIGKARVLFVVTLALDDQAREFLKTHPSTQLHNLVGWVKRCIEFL